MTASSSSTSSSADRIDIKKGLDLQRHWRGDLGHDLLSQCTKFERSPLHVDARLGTLGRGRHATGIPSQCLLGPFEERRGPECRADSHQPPLDADAVQLGFPHCAWHGRADSVSPAKEETSADMPGRAREESASSGRLCRSRMHQHENGAHFVEYGQV